MRITRSAGCIFGVVFAVVFAVLAIIGIIILVNTIKSIDYQAAAKDIVNGVKDFNSTLRSINTTEPSTIPTTAITTYPLF